MSVQYRLFPRESQKVSALGMGCMRLPEKDGAVDVPRAVALIRRAVDGGVNYLDTAYTYHNQQSERVVGEALRDGYRERVLLATKLPVWKVEKPEDMEAVFAEQLSKLGVEYVDVYLLHALDRKRFEKMRALGAFAFLRRLRQQGRARMVGFSFHDEADVFREILAAFDWDVCQVQMNLLDERRQATMDGVRLAAQRGMGVIVMEPLRGGALTKTAPAEVDALYEACAPGRSRADWAFRYLLDRPEITTILSGMSTPEQVDENLRIFDAAGPGCLTAAERETLARVREAYEKRIPIGCTGCGYCQPCPQGVKIPEIFQAYDRAAMFDDRAAFRAFYAKEERPGCVGCLACESACPQHFAMPIHLRIQAIAEEMRS